MGHSLAIWGEGVCCFINFMDSLYILHPNLLATYRYRLHLLHSASFFSFLLMSFGDKKFLISMSTNFAIFPLHLMLLVSSLKKMYGFPRLCGCSMLSCVYSFILSWLAQLNWWSLWNLSLCVTGGSGQDSSPCLWISTVPAAPCSQTTVHSLLLSSGPYVIYQIRRVCLWAPCAVPLVRSKIDK